MLQRAIDLSTSAGGSHPVDGQDVISHAACGSKIAAAAKQQTVAFEADSYDAFGSDFTWAASEPLAGARP